MAREARKARAQARAADARRPVETHELPAYARLLLAVLTGDAALSIRGDEAEESWRVVAPVLSAWSKDLVPMQEYPAGSAGPRP